MSAWSGKTVLVVDDSASVRQQVTMTYRSVGVEVIGEATNGVEALEKLESLKPDLVSLDIIMPEMDGVECFRKIRARFPEQKVVVLSCLSSEPRIHENLKETVPVELFLSKPLDTTDLEHKLEYFFSDEVAKAEVVS